MSRNYHKWNNDICIKCKVIRKTTALSPNLRNRFNTYFYEYFINNKWIQDRPNCNKTKDK